MENLKEKAKELVLKMTLEEKISQMLYNSAEIKRLGILAYNWWNEALHGVARSGTATVFPQAIALAATFDPLLIQKTAEIISTEARAKFNAYQKHGDFDMYKGLTFWSPNINIYRDPRWGRGHETYGEDPYLSSVCGAAFIRGLQCRDGQYLKAAACAKHFAAHSGPEDKRHSFNVDINLYDLWNTYLPAFEAAVKEGGVEGVMGAYNRLLGQPCCGSHFLLTQILRDKWGFDGYVVSDCMAIKDFYAEFGHAAAKDETESAAKAINAGCDLDCGDSFLLAAKAVKEGLINSNRIDEAVTRLLTTRMRLGILGGGSKYDSVPYQAVDSLESRAFNLEVSKRSIVMLKNNGALPLRAEKIKTIGVIGPNADNINALKGNYHGTASKYITVLDGVRDFAEKREIRVMFAQGAHIFKDSVEILTRADDRLSEALEVALRADAVIVCLGLDRDIEGEEAAQCVDNKGGDRLSINLPAKQNELIKAVRKAALGKPVIAVVISGGAISLIDVDKNSDVVLQAFYPGALGGQAVAQAIFGEFSPSGKLPVTFYASDGDLPDFEDYSMQNRTYRYFKGAPLYPFGFGLGYCKFSLRDFKAGREFCTVKVKNNGKMPAFETVQIYITSPGQKEIRNLCGLRPVFLKPLEETEIKINLWKNAFSRCDDNGDLYIVKGKHLLSAGFVQPDERSKFLYGANSHLTEFVSI
ncbi:MAG: glycoside hydrolase family 3 C-terminal domain-containing protein [Endomicrobium sp.]|nr:glycoside hydrolase family 3 C-terminal domain-containing protein [Endomicrobium sp.]